jgi:hypothetical protein
MLKVRNYNQMLISLRCLKSYVLVNVYEVVVSR